MWKRYSLLRSANDSKCRNDGGGRPSSIEAISNSLRSFESGLLPRDGRPCCPCRHGCRNRFCSELTVTSANFVTRERKNLFSELLFFFRLRAEHVTAGLGTIRIGDCGN